jgi:hypothetical protein
MKNSSKVIKEGCINLETLFKGSKSESVYPVLTCQDGSKYRIHIKKNESPDAPLLAHLEGLHVRIEGDHDRIRGHDRILVSSDLDSAIFLISNETLQDKSIALNLISTSKEEK